MQDTIKLPYMIQPLKIAVEKVWAYSPSDVGISLESVKLGNLNLVCKLMLDEY